MMYSRSPIISSPRVETVKIASRSCRIFIASPFRDRAVPFRESSNMDPFFGVQLPIFQTPPSLLCHRR